MSEHAKQAAEIIKKQVPNFVPKVGMILGSGLGSLAESIENAVVIPYEELPNFSIGSSKVLGHGRKLYLGTLMGVPVACLSGRVHTYEGVAEALSVIKTLVRTFKLLGCEMLLQTNAVGSLNKDFGPGSLMVIADHINYMFSNSLIGPNHEGFGDRFVSMDNVYDADLRAILMDIAVRNKMSVFEGVYLGDSGPTFETHAEIRAFKIWGADAVGMSTVQETIVARHCGMKVAAISAITNFAAGISDEILSHEGTLKGGQLAVGNLLILLREFISELKHKFY